MPVDTALILAGGLGTRLRSAVPDLPKVLAPVGGRPFLEYLFLQLLKYEFREAVVSVGYRAEQIKRTFGSSYQSLKIEYVTETTPLGTGGGLKLAASVVRNYPVLVMNGDSFCDLDLQDFVKYHAAKSAQLTMALTSVADSNRFGKVLIDDAGKVLAFEEKQAVGGPGLINAGLYLCSEDVPDLITAGTVCSLERDLFPRLLNGSFYGYAATATFIDIGIPESLAAAQDIIPAIFGIGPQL
ncbi:MAG: NTP transferase domain-containing protein [Deltaproteobacteria bacterium]|nr:NTP transferase domain-containing protein [Deltaproteobacteria bacterium]